MSHRMSSQGRRGTGGGRGPGTGRGDGSGGGRGRRRFAEKPQVAITDLKAVAIEEPVSRRQFVVIAIETDAGVTGIGETLARREAQEEVARIHQQKQQLIGQDALAAEAVRQTLGHRLAGGRSRLQAAVNMALLDVVGKLARAPTYEVLGGPTRKKARAMAPLVGRSPAELADSLQRNMDLGYRAFAVPLPYVETVTRGPSFFRRTYSLLDALRQRAGENADFVLDCGNQLRAAEAVGLARQLEGFHLLWLDEPCSPATAEALAKISDETVVPLGAGRDVSSNAVFADWLREDAVDVLRPDVSHNGISQIRKAAALAETYYVAVAPLHRGGPVMTAAALQIAASIPNFFIQEVPLPALEADRKMRRELVEQPIEDPSDGFLPLPDGPGLGVTLNQDALAKYRVSS